MPSSRPETTEPVELAVRSEVAPLERVLVHRPGPELDRVDPDRMHELLFEDLLFGGRAREEHRILCRLLATVSGSDGTVVELLDLFEDCLHRTEAREAFVDALCRRARHRNYEAARPELLKLTPDELLTFTLTGSNPLSLEAAPAPNLMFTRDLGSVVGSHLVLSHAARKARIQETLILRTVAEYHPAFSGERTNVITLPETVTFEGGDLLVASPDTVLVGLSERTGLGGAHAITRSLFARTEFDHVFLVDVPKRRASMHLDTVFTFVSENECVVYPEFVEGDRFNVVHYRRPEGFRAGAASDASDSEKPGEHPFTARIHSNLKHALRRVLDRPLRYIPCGGSDPLDQRREQWTDAANLFAVRPGVVIGYERNGRTFEALAEHDYRVVSAADVLSTYGNERSPSGEKLAIKLEGNELSRGRGGARCLTLPLRRS